MFCHNIKVPMKLFLLNPAKLRALPHSTRWTLIRTYHENIIDHYENPRNVGSLDKKKKTVGTGLVGAPACGDVMKLQFETDENGVIIDGKHIYLELLATGNRLMCNLSNPTAKFKTFGCGSAIASSSLATEWLKGKTLEECMAIKVTASISDEASLLIVFTIPRVVGATEHRHRVPS